MNCKIVGKGLLDSYLVGLWFYDLLVWEGCDLCVLFLVECWVVFEVVVFGVCIDVLLVLDFVVWDDLVVLCVDFLVVVIEGVMIKCCDSVYVVG